MNIIATLPSAITVAANDVSSFWTDTGVGIMVTIGLSLLVWGLVKRGTRRA